MKILIAGNFSFRSSAANALRVRGIAEALRLAGDDVRVMDNGRLDTSGDNPIGPFHLTTVDEYGSGLLSFAPAGVRGLFLGDQSAMRVRAGTWRPDRVILYGPHLGYLLRFQRLCREMRIPLVLDIVEWYQPEDLPGGRFGPYALANEFSMGGATHRVDGVIAISRRLEDHYLSRAGSVINVPPLFEPEPAPAAKWSEADGRIHLCYAGTPGGKEAFQLLLTALRNIEDRGVDFVLHSVGLTLADFLAATGLQTWGTAGPALDRVRFYGRVANSKARALVAASDFTLLMRPLRKANQFGFPSKLAESMAVGTPVIANSFSDLERYLAPDRNAIFFPDLNVASATEALLRAAALSSGQRRIIAEQALLTARGNFAPSAVSHRLSSFLKGLSCKP